MKLSQFKFKLPESQIALEPTHRTFQNEDGTEEKIYRRDECRLMVIHRKSQSIESSPSLNFRNIVDYFDDGDTFIFNDTKVFQLVSMVRRRRPMPR